MPQRLLFALFAIAASALSAQVELTAAYFPVVGDTLKSDTADSTYAASLDFSQAGADVFWDFGTPVSVNERSEAVDALGAADTLFPGATLKIQTTPTTESFYLSTATDFTLVGLQTSFDLLPDLTLTTPVNPGRSTRRAPLRYLDVYMTETSNATVISPDSLPEAARELIGDALDNVDSLRITTLSSRTDVVDAWGTVKINGNRFDVLREVRTEAIEIRLAVKTGFLPFIDVTGTIAILDPDLAEFVGPQPITVTYFYWSPGVKEPIVEIATLEETGAVTNVNYKRTERATSTDGPQFRQARVKVYPNPATELATFEIEGLSRGEYHLTLTNGLGQRVDQRTFSPLGDQTRVSLDVSRLPQGAYIYSLRNERGRTVAAKRLIVR